MARSESSPLFLVFCDKCFFLVCSYLYDYREETETTEEESVESDDSDEETEETKQGNPYLRPVIVSLPQPYDDRSRIRLLLSE